MGEKNEAPLRACIPSHCSGLRQFARTVSAAQRRIGVYDRFRFVTFRAHLVNEEAMHMELTRSLNLVMILAAFVFVGAMVMGVVP
ncbi:MAG TPA: hypothetical protein ENH55_12445 [Aurantimonas coralicida]|uniref:Uncharacterized protein n=2 Tax=root TaxID=1 RepID=A0A9C9NJA1_9HYPH|nr:hypothetical protein [Aurantimonas coralicida]HEU02871.1 hypothetical protein [Aurantimonas coralicida]